MKLKITTVGNSAGVILPKELLARLRLEKGDELFALETPGGIVLTTYDPELAAQMEVGSRRGVLINAPRPLSSVRLTAIGRSRQPQFPFRRVTISRRHQCHPVEAHD